MGAKNTSMVLTKIDHYNILFENSIDPILLIRGHFFIDCNKAAMKMLNMSSKIELLQIHPSSISPEFQPSGESSKEKANAMINLCYKKGFNRFEWLHQTIDGRKFWVEVTLKSIRVDNEDILYVIWRDIDQVKKYEFDLKQQNEQLQKNYDYISKINQILKDSDKKSENLFDTLRLLEEYKKAIDESSIVSKTDLNGVITYVNDKFCEISGYTKEELLGQKHNIIKDPSNPESYYEHLWKTISNKKVFKSIFSNRSKNGKIYYVNSTIIPILDNNNNIKEYIGIRNDITELYEKNKIIYKQFTDELTGLQNRQKLLEDINNVKAPKLAIINIDRFKDINDSYGISFGDDLLKQISKKLLTFRSSSLNVYRIGGDIFALLGFNHFSLVELEKTCKSFITKIDSENSSIKNNIFDLSFTIGMSSGTKKLLTNTEIALSHAKRDNKDILIFDEKIDGNQKLKENIQLTKDIKDAIRNDNILLYGQKIINNFTQEVKYETLMRMKLEDGTILSPYAFLEHAKKARIYPILTKIIIEKACEYFKDRDNKFSINLTIEDIANEQIVEFLINKLIETDCAKKVILEIVESEGIERFDEVMKFINRVKKIGCQIAIDDFGTGYSNFEYIIKLNIDILKIDGSLIKNIHLDKNMYITVSAIVNFAKALGIELVAEFVHSKEVHEIIKSLEIDYTQGYFLHEPEHLS